MVQTTYNGNLLNVNDYADYITSWRERKKFPMSSFAETEKMLAKLMLIVEEIAEAGDACRHGDEEGFHEELADAIIRILDICGAHKIDIEYEIIEKMSKNEQRPELHGKLA